MRSSVLEATLALIAKNIHTIYKALTNTIL